MMTVTGGKYDIKKSHITTIDLVTLLSMEQFGGHPSLKEYFSLHLTSHNNSLDPFGPSPSREQQDNEQDNNGRRVVV
jgi:hypothetical protein